VLISGVSPFLIYRSRRLSEFPDSFSGSLALERQMTALLIVFRVPGIAPLAVPVEDFEGVYSW
jgi:hypothetical protein